MDPTDYLSEEPQELTFTIFPDGDYDFTIGDMFAVETSKKGNPMIPIDLLFTHPEDQASFVKVREYLVFIATAKFKIDQLLAALQVPNSTRINFTDPEFQSYLKRRKGRATLVTETFQKRDGTDGSRNVISSYVYDGTSKRDAAPTARTSPPPLKAKPIPIPAAFDDDDIPF